MFDGYTPPSMNQPRLPPTGERTQERRLINVEEQIEFTQKALPKGLVNFIAEYDPDAIKACPYWTSAQAKDWAGIVAYIKRMEIETGRYYGDEKELRTPLRETVTLIQEKLKELSSGKVEPGTAAGLSDLMKQLRELQRELYEPEEPLPSFLLEAYQIAYKAWIAATAVNQPFLLEQHVGGRGGGGYNGYG